MPIFSDPRDHARAAWFKITKPAKINRVCERAHQRVLADKHLHMELKLRLGGKFVPTH